MATTWVSGIDFEDRWTPPEHEPAAGELDWAEVYGRYRLQVQGFVRSRVPAAWVEDTVQDTFVRAYRSRQRLDPARPLWPWLVTIARRACIETCRNHRAELAFDGSLHSGAAPDDPHVEFERRQRAAAIAGALEALPARHRRLLVRYEVEGRSYAALAGEEAISGQALKSVLCRAREGFRTRYETLAEANGLVTLPVLGPLLVRLRSRWSRSHDAVSRMSPEMAGALFMGLTATAWVIGVPTAQKATSSPAMANVVMIGDALGAAAPDFPGTSAVDVAAAVAPSSAPPAAHLHAPPASDKALPAYPLIPRAAGKADVVNTAEASTISVAVDFGVATGDGERLWVVRVECGDGLSRPVCDAVRSAGVGE